MSEEIKKPETMEDFTKELEASFENMRESDDVTWVTLQDLKDSKTILEVKIEGIVKSGVVAYVEGVRGFIPASKLSLHYVEDLNEFLNKKILVRVFDLDEEAKKLVLSAKEILKEEEEKEKQSKMEKLKPGMVLEGIVDTIQPYGAFVNLENGLTGLLHISQISQKRLKSPSEVLTVGDKVTVKLTALKDGKLSLSMKALQENADSTPDIIDYDIPKSEEVTTSLGSLFANIKL